jgi:hypothetical protein
MRNVSSLNDEYELSPDKTGFRLLLASGMPTGAAIAKTGRYGRRLKRRLNNGDRSCRFRTTEWKAGGG